jgi:hypothetical protein
VWEAVAAEAAAVVRKTGAAEEAEEAGEFKRLFVSTPVALEAAGALAPDAAGARLRLQTGVGLLAAGEGVGAGAVVEGD